MAKHTPKDLAGEAQPKNRTPLNQLSIGQVVGQLREVRKVLLDPEAKAKLPRVVRLALLKRERDLSRRLVDIADEGKYKAQMTLLANPHGLTPTIQAQRAGDENPPRKAQCKAPNRGYYRPPRPSPTGKTVGAYRVEMPERPGPDKLLKDKGK